MRRQFCTVSRHARAVFFSFAWGCTSSWRQPLSSVERLTSVGICAPQCLLPTTCYQFSTCYLLPACTEAIADPYLLPEIFFLIMVDCAEAVLHLFPAMHGQFFSFAWGCISSGRQPPSVEILTSVGMCAPQYLLPNTYYLLPATCYLLLASCYLLPATCYLVPGTCYTLPATYYPLPTT